MPIFKYTRTSLNVLYSTFLKVSLAFKILMYIIPLGYYIYLMTTPNPTWFHITFLCLMVAFGIFDCLTSTLFNLNKDSKSIIKHIYSLIKILVKGVVLGINIFELYELSLLNTNSIVSFEMIITLLSIIAWVLSVIIEVVVWIVERSINFLMTSIEVDKNVINDTYLNIKEKITHQEINDKDYKKRKVLKEKLNKRFKKIKDNKGFIFAKEDK